MVVAALVGYLVLIGGIMDTFDIANEQLETVYKINQSVSRIGSKILIYHQLAYAMFSFNGYVYIVFFFHCPLKLVFFLFKINLYFYAFACGLENINP